MSLWKRPSSDDELDREIRDHIDLEAEERRASGATDDEAAFAARRRFGNVGLVKEAVRATRWSARFDTLTQDLRFALRGLRRSPAFTATAVLSLTLGIGANTAVFSLINALILRPLAVAEPEQLVQVAVVGQSEQRLTFSYPAVRALSDETTGLTGLCGFAHGESFAIGEPGSDRRVSGTWMTGDCHRVLGIRFAIGRGFTRDDDRPEGGTSGLVAVVSDAYWSREWHRSRDIVGKQIVIEGKRVTIIGVTSAGFDGPNIGRRADITMPVASLPRLRADGPPIYRRGINWLRLWGRLPSETRPARAEAQLGVAWTRIVGDLFEGAALASMRGARVVLLPGATGFSDLRRQFTRPLVVLTTIVALVLLIACANLASLLLARAASRRREFAVRLAMGAGRGRLIRQVFTENVLLAALGAIAGLAFAQVALRGVLALLAEGRGRSIALDVGPDPPVLAFTLGVAMATSLLFGLAPALRATAVDETSALRDAARSRAARRGHLASILVVVQAGLSLVLVAGAAFFGRTLNNLLHVDAGFRRDGVTLVSVDIPAAARERAPQAALAEEILDELRAIPGVRAVTVSGSTPLTGAGWTLSVGVESKPTDGSPETVIITASPSYLDVYGIALRGGRDFSRADGANAPAVVLVNEAFARKRLGGVSPLGQRLRIGGRDASFEIVGVVGDVTLEGMRRPTPPAVYLSFFQAPNPQLSGGANIALLAEREPPTTEVIRARVRARAPLAGLDIRPFHSLVDSTLSNERLMALLATFFGSLALALAAVGLYGLLAFDVTSRTGEIGVRTALGATRANLLWLVMSDALRLTGAGTIVGVPIIWALSRFVSGMLFGLTATDPSTIAIAVSLILGATLAASYLPARRAMRIDPNDALKYE